MFLPVGGGGGGGGEGEWGWGVLPSKYYGDDHRNC